MLLISTSGWSQALFILSIFPRTSGIALSICWFVYLLIYSCMHACIWFVCAGTNAAVHIWRSEDNSVESFLSSHLYLDSGIWTQDTRHAWQTPLASEASGQPPNVFLKHNSSSSSASLAFNQNQNHSISILHKKFSLFAFISLKTMASSLSTSSVRQIPGMKKTLNYSVIANNA